MKFRKKPVVIEARRLRAGETLDSAFVGDWMDRIRYTESGSVLIETLEGTHEGKPGDWIIRGVNGELYPCKPDIFAKTYEPADIEALGTIEGWHDGRTA